MSIYEIEIEENPKHVEKWHKNKCLRIVFKKYTVWDMSFFFQTYVRFCKFNLDNDLKRVKIEFFSWKHCKMSWRIFPSKQSVLLFPIWLSNPLERFLDFYQSWTNEFRLRWDHWVMSSSVLVLLKYNSITAIGP